MWYLEWISGIDEHDSNEHTHSQQLPNVKSINDQLEARELAIIAWEDVCKNPQAIKELYRDPHLVWKEPLA